MTNWLAASFCLLLIGYAFAGGYVREHNYDTTTHPDDAAVNVSLVSNRWPDCSTLETTIESIFRLEGVADRAKTSDQDRALALWKWFRIMVSATGGGYVYEQANPTHPVTDPHKILTVYGHHQCDGMSWSMVPLWRAAGYMAFDECHNGHTIAALRYKDADGQVRYHNLDPQGRFYYWDEEHNRIGTWSMPVFTGHIFRHLMTPLNVHTMRTNLRIGETIERNWTNTGHIIPPGRPAGIDKTPYYEYKPGKVDGVYAVAGEERQIRNTSFEPGVLKPELLEGAENIRFVGGPGVKAITPVNPDQDAVLVYHLSGPFVMTLFDFMVHYSTTDEAGFVDVSVSRDGGPFQSVKLPPPDKDFPIKGMIASTQADAQVVRGGYDARVRITLKPKKGKPVLVSFMGTISREFNKRTLPNIMPGENVYRVNADKLPDDYMLKLTMKYERNATGKPPATQPVELTYLVDKVPFYFKIDEKFKLRKITNYDKDFNNETVRMVGYRMELVPKKGGAAIASRAVPGPGVEPSVSLPAGECEAKFALPFPHPGDMTDRKIRKGDQVEHSILQTNGHLPQSDQPLKDDPAKVAELIKQIEATGEFKQYVLIQQLGDYSGQTVLDYLHTLLPKMNIDGTVYVVKGLARLADPRSIDPLLAKWAAGMKSVDRDPPGGSTGGAPGTRCIPDALVAIVVAMEKNGLAKADIDAARAKSVKALLGPLAKLRFDFRFYIAHALGVLGKGSPEAEAALKDLAENDPFPPIREEAKAAIEKLHMK